MPPRREIPTPPPPQSRNPRSQNSGDVWARIARQLAAQGQARRAKSPPREAIRRKLGL